MPLHSAASYRVAFLTSPRGTRWHVPSADGKIESLVVPLDGPPTKRDLQVVSAFNPHVIFVLNPEQLARRDIEALPGLIVGHTSATLSNSELDHLRELFPATDRRCGVTHLDQRDIPLLASRSIHELGALLLPIDEVQYRIDDTFDHWCHRSIPLAFIGRPTRGTSAVLLELAKIPGFVRVDPEVDDVTIRGILSQTQCSIHLADPNHPLQTASLALRDMSMGCLVIANKFRVDYSLMAGEHFVYYRDLVAAAHIARTAVEIRDHQDVIRSVGRARAFEFAATDIYFDFIQRQLCATHNPLAEAPI